MASGSDSSAIRYERNLRDAYEINVENGTVETPVSSNRDATPMPS